VKTGKVQGFSIDGLLSLKEVNFKSEINMSKEVLEETQKQTSILTELANAIKTAFSKPEEKEVKLGEIKTADGTITIEYEGEELVAGVSAWINAEDDTRVPVPVGEHPLENGMVIVVTEEGLVAEVKEMVQEAPEQEAPAQEPMSETAKNDAEIAKEIETAIKSILIKYSEMEKKIDAVIKENADLKVALSETPATTRVKAVPTQVELKTAKQRLFNKITNK
jgi:hypothetical protein